MSRGTISDRLPPYNIEAEEGVLGSGLLDVQSIDDMVAIVSPGDFYRKSHEILWREMIGFSERDEPLDAITLVERLNRLGKLDEVGGLDAIHEIMNGVPSAVQGTYYASIVRQKSISRQLIEMANRMLRDGYSNSYDASELIQRADLDLSRISDGESARKLASIGDAATDSLRRFDLRQQGQITGITSGFHRLDEITGGYRPAQLIVVAARPGMGKTSYALNVMEHVARLFGKTVLFFSLEMGLGELGDRAVSGGAGFDSSDYRFAKGQRIDRDAIVRKVADLQGLPIWIDESADRTPSQIASIARKAKRHGDIGLIVVDYLQIIGADGSGKSDYERIGDATRALKNLSKQVQTPVIALSQLSRKCEERSDKRPMLIDLRSTGQIEQEADNVMFLYRDHYYDNTKDPNLGEFIVAKNREGACGTVEVFWDGRLTRFENMEAKINFGPPDDGQF